MKTQTFDPVRTRQHLLTRLARLETGIIRTAAPLGGCELRAEYIANVLSVVHEHLVAMLDDMRGNINTNIDRLETELDQLNDIGEDILGDIINRVDLERS